MAFEQQLAESVRAGLAHAGTIREVKMFGGIGFMLNGNMVAAASRRGLLLRIGKERQAEALTQPCAQPMVMRGRTMEGYVYVDPAGLDSKAIRIWLKLAVLFVQILPAKTNSGPVRKKGETK